MKKIKLLFTGLMLFSFYSNAQDIVIAGWTFPGSSAVADTGLTVNLENEISTMGGTSDIEFKNGFDTKAAQATEWHDGQDLKAWVVNLSTEGYNNLTVSSRQQSGGNDPGPMNFKIQYSLDDGETWSDVVDGDITVENDWETSFIDNLSLPEACFDQTLLLIRWAMASNEASGGSGVVLEDGKSKIDEIYIRGDLINSTEEILISQDFTVYPNPAIDVLNIKSDSDIGILIISDLSGRILIEQCVDAQFWQADISQLSKGYYLIYTQNNSIIPQKLMVD